MSLHILTTEPTTTPVDTDTNSVKAERNDLSRHPAQQGIQSGPPRLLSQGTGAAFSETESVKAVNYPYFPFYVKDFVADIKVQAMNTEAIGAYLLLLCAAWQENPPATLPQDDSTLAAYCRLSPSRWQELKPAVLSPFHTEGRRYVQNRLRSEFRKIEAVHAAKVRGGQNRWSPNRSPDSTPPLRAYGSGSENPESEKKVKPPWTPEEWESARKNLGATEDQARECWAWYDSEGWKRTKQNGAVVPLQGDPRSLLTTWMANPIRQTNGESPVEPPKRKLVFLP